MNISRGNIIDKGALVEALRVKKISGARLDVFSTEPLPANNPLRDLENVVLSPHVAGFGVPNEVDALVGMFYDNIKRYLSGKEFRDAFTLMNAKS